MSLNIYKNGALQKICGNYIVDSALSSTSTNAVQNKVIKTETDSIRNLLGTASEASAVTGNTAFAKINSLNSALSMLDEVTVSDYSAELSAYDRIYVKDKSKVYIKGRFVGDFTQGTEKKMFNVSQVPKLNFTTQPTNVMFSCGIFGAINAPAYGYVKANGDVCVISTETINSGTCVIDIEYQY